MASGKKSADNSYEARGKRLGIIGYGHIGTQLVVACWKPWYACLLLRYRKQAIFG